MPGPTAPIVTADSVTPSSGSGATQTFALQYSHSYGAAELRTVHVQFRESFVSSAINTCLVFYDHVANSLFLATDSISDWRSASLGTTATLQNSQCAIAVGSSSVTLAGNTLTLNLAMTFKPAFAGSKHIYMYAGVGAAVSGWQDRGNWTVPGPTAPLVMADENCHAAEQSVHDCGGKQLGNASPQHRPQPLLLHALSGSRRSRIEPAFNLQKHYRVARGWLAHLNFERSRTAHRALNPTVLMAAQFVLLAGFVAWIVLNQ